MCLPNILFPVFMFAFIFHCHSFSPCWPLAFLIFSPPLWIFMVFFLQNSSPLVSITRSSSFSFIHVSVNIKNNAKKDTTLLLFFLSKIPGGHVISFQIKPWVAFRLPVGWLLGYLLIELFYIGMPVVRTVARSLALSVYRHVITKFSRMGRLPHFLSYGAPRAELSHKFLKNKLEPAIIWKPVTCQRITSKKYSTSMGRHLSPWYGQVIWSAGTLFWQLSIGDNIDVQSTSSWASKEVKKCESNMRSRIKSLY